jgi:hypothetical protein
MNVHEYVKFAKARLEKFDKYWHTHPEYPVEIDETWEWDEQLHAYVESIET